MGALKLESPIVFQSDENVPVTGAGSFFFFFYRLNFGRLTTPRRLVQHSEPLEKSPAENYPRYFPRLFFLQIKGGTCPRGESLCVYFFFCRWRLRVRYTFYTYFSVLRTQKRRILRGVAFGNRK